MSQECTVEEEPRFDLETPQIYRRVSFKLTLREYELAKRLAEYYKRNIDRKMDWRGGVSMIAKLALLDAINLALKNKIISDEDLP